MSKRYLCIFLSLLMLICFNAPIYASQSEREVIQLKPDAQTEKVLSDVNLIIDSDNSITLNIKGYKEKDAELESFFIDVDRNTNTYKATKAKGKELDMILEGIRKNNPSFDSKATSASARGSYSIGVAATTLDPAGLTLCQTYNELYWTANGSTATFQSRYQDYFAACPTPPPYNTHWYCSSIYWTGLIQGTTAITSTNEANYYNYDFMDDSLITNVTHNTLCYGDKNGSGDYWAGSSVSGEYSFLLSFNFTVY